MSRRSDITIHVILPAYRPSRDWLAIQIASILAQSDVATRIWLCPDGVDEIATSVAERFKGSLTRLAFDQRVGVLANVERGLEAALSASASNDLFAFADQDDIWHPDKLAKSVAALPSGPIAVIGHDARVIDAEGGLVASSLHAYERRHGQLDQLSLLIANTLSGMTMLATREAVAAALPFPRSLPDLLHDWWLALLVSGKGRVAWLDELLLDYRQHAENVIGAKPTEASRRLTLSPKRPFLGSRYRRMARDTFAARRGIALELYARDALADPATAFFLERRLWPLLRHWGGGTTHYVFRCGLGMLLT